MDEVTQVLNITVALNSTPTESPLVTAVNESAKWVLGFIIILGLITNSLILVILSRKRIGSQTTRIILIFLAVTDFFIMIVEFLIHYVPHYWRWFPVFYSDLSCGFSMLFQASIITSSSWYLMLMTAERFTVVFFPIKAKIICTQKKVIVACVLIPILSLASYSYLAKDFMSYQRMDYTFCKPKPSNMEGFSFKTKIQIWIILYFFIPAIFIVLLNACIVFRLSQAQKIQRSLTSTSSKRMVKQQSSVSNSNNSIKKATTLVIVASITFVILMIPRGVSTTISLDANWKYQSEAEEILDMIAYFLQYLNHAINFFLYVLANNSFRSNKPKYLHRRLPMMDDTEDTQMTTCHPKSYCHGRVKDNLHYCIQTIGNKDDNHDQTRAFQVKS